MNLRFKGVDASIKVVFCVYLTKVGLKREVFTGDIPSHRLAAKYLCGDHRRLSHKAQMIMASCASGANITDIKDPVNQRYD